MSDSVMQVELVSADRLVWSGEMYPGTQETIPPKRPDICRLARSWPGWVTRPG